MIGWLVAICVFLLIVSVFSLIMYSRKDTSGGSVLKVVFGCSCYASKSATITPKSYRGLLCVNHSTLTSRLFGKGGGC
jgi:hypothetical protein